MTLGFVTPWYGDDIGGGAESECRALVKLLSAHQCDVEVLTTCVRDFRSDWSSNYHRPGVSVEGGVRVRRFPVRVRDTKAFDEVNHRLMQGEAISAEEEDCFFREMINSPELYGYLTRNSQRYLWFFIPYMFGTTYYGSMVCPERSVLIPCLHDEAYAQLERIQRTFRNVREIVFQSPEEEKLARQLYGLSDSIGTLIGAPVDCSWTSEASHFHQKYGLSHFLLYAGRTDVGKNADLLVDYFHRYVAEHSTGLGLVFIGGGNIAVPDEIAGRVVSLGYLPTQDKYDCYAASLALCIPSVMESFSIVMMESWLAGRPVIVNADCAVTTDFCKRSNGGLYFGNYEEFREIVSFILESPSIASRLGQQGRAFVRTNYSPDIVVERYLKLVEQFCDGEIAVKGAQPLAGSLPHAHRG